MSGMTTSNMGDLTRAIIYSNEIKEILEETLMASTYVDFLTDFPDGDTFQIPSVGDVYVNDYVEDTAVEYRPLDTGLWQFSITEYLSSGNYITKKAMQDAYLSSQLQSMFVPKQARAIAEHFEATVLATPESIYAANEQGTINTAHHRMSGSGSGQISITDFAYARHALTKANVPQTNLVAIVPPEVEFYMNTLTNLVDVSYNPRWEGIVSDSIGTGMRFTRNIYGFDVYVSNFLPDITDNALPQYDGSTTNDYSSANGKPCYFFSSAADVVPWKAAWRQMPEVDEEYNKDYQRYEYVTTCRYGTGFYRPENMVMVATSTAIS